MRIHNPGISCSGPEPGEFKVVKIDWSLMLVNGMVGSQKASVTSRPVSAGMINRRCNVRRRVLASCRRFGARRRCGAAHGQQGRNAPTFWRRSMVKSHLPVSGCCCKVGAGATDRAPVDLGKPAATMTTCREEPAACNSTSSAYQISVRFDRTRQLTDHAAAMYLLPPAQRSWPRNRSAGFAIAS